MYPAMEDFGLDVMLGKGPVAKSIRLDLPKFTIIGATTRAGALSAPARPLRPRPPARVLFPDEMIQIIERAAGILGVRLDREAAEEIATRSRLTPRIANRLLKRVRDYAQVNQVDTITRRHARDALHLLEIDDLGLDTSDRRCCRPLSSITTGAPSALQHSPPSAPKKPSTIEDVYEPYLMQIGLLERTARGRRVTPKASHRCDR
jgi:Holliday junction DNA helicase RuvB